MYMYTVVQYEPDCPDTTSTSIKTKYNNDIHVYRDSIMTN